MNAKYVGGLSASLKQLTVGNKTLAEVCHPNITLPFRETVVLLRDFYRLL
jgi:hypothetical protein